MGHSTFPVAADLGMVEGDSEAKTDLNVLPTKSTVEAVESSAVGSVDSVD